MLNGHILGHHLAVLLDFHVVENFALNLNPHILTDNYITDIVGQKNSYL